MIPFATKEARITALFIILVSGQSRASELAAEPPSRGAHRADQGAAQGADSVGEAATEIGEPPGEPRGELQTARKLFAQAELDEDAGNWAAALKKIQAVAAIRATPGVRFHEALCLENLGQISAALAGYEEAERQAQRESNSEVLEAVREPLALLRQRVPKIKLNIDPAVEHAAVTIDGAPITSAAAAAPVQVDPGAHEIRATAASRVAFSKVVVLRERESVAVDVALQPQPRALGQVAMPSEAQKKNLLSPNSLNKSERRFDGSAIAPWLLAGGAAVFAVGGATAYALAGARHDEAVARCREQTTPCTGASSVRMLDTLALGAWFGAGALAGGAIVLWTSVGKKPAEVAQNKVRVLAGMRAITLDGNF